MRGDVLEDRFAVPSYAGNAIFRRSGQPDPTGYIRTSGRAGTLVSRESESRRVEPEKVRGGFRAARFTACWYTAHEFRLSPRTWRRQEKVADRSSSGGGGRRRRGGRGRSGSSHSHWFFGQRELALHTNGSIQFGPEEEGRFSLEAVWVSSKASSPRPRSPIKHTPRTTSARPDFKEREPRAERPERTDRPDRTAVRTERPPQRGPSPRKPSPLRRRLFRRSSMSAISPTKRRRATCSISSPRSAHVKNVEVAMDRHGRNRSKGFGFVEMESLETAKLPPRIKLNRTDFMGRQIVVSGAKLDKRRESGAEPREEDARPRTSQRLGTGSATSTDSQRFKEAANGSIEDRRHRKVPPVFLLLKL